VKKGANKRGAGRRLAHRRRRGAKGAREKLGSAGGAFVDLTGTPLGEKRKHVKNERGNRKETWGGHRSRGTLLGRKETRLIVREKLRISQRRRLTKALGIRGQKKGWGGEKFASLEGRPGEGSRKRGGEKAFKGGTCRRDCCKC